MTRQNKLSSDIGAILLASNLGDLDPHEASAMIANLIEVHAMHAVVEALKDERRRPIRPRVRLAAPALV